MQQFATFWGMFLRVTSFGIIFKLIEMAYGQVKDR